MNFSIFCLINSYFIYPDYANYPESHLMELLHNALEYFASNNKNRQNLMYKIFLFSVLQQHTCQNQFYQFIKSSIKVNRAIPFGKK